MSCVGLNGNHMRTVDRRPSGRCPNKCGVREKNTYLLCFGDLVVAISGTLGRSMAPPACTKHYPETEIVLEHRSAHPAAEDSEATADSKTHCPPSSVSVPAGTPYGLVVCIYCKVNIRLVVN